MKVKPFSSLLRATLLLLACLQPLIILPGLVLAAVPPNSAVGPYISRASASASVVDDSVDTLAQYPSVPRFEPLRLEVHFSPEPTAREIFEAPIFQQPLVPVGTPSTEENIALAQALMAYIRRTDSDDNSPLVAYLSSYPSSPWKPALLFNLGCAWRESGFFSKAIASWEEAWRLTKTETEINSRALADRTVAELVKIHSWVGNMGRLDPLASEVKDRRLLGGSKEVLQCAYEGRANVERHPDDWLKCGAMALRQILSVNKTNADPRILFSKKPSKKGFSLTRLKELADESGLQYQMAKRAFGASIPPNSIIHWKLNHYGVVANESGDKYQVLDTTFNHLYGSSLSISKAALEEESDGYFLIRDGPLPAGWQEVKPEEGQTIFGKGRMADKDGNATTPQDETTCPTAPGGNQAMAQYRAHLMLCSLNIVDTPVGYSPPVGPPVQFKVTYSQRDNQSMVNPASSNLGNQWTCDWFTYIRDLGDVGDHSFVTRYVSGGGQIVYSNYNASTGFYSPDRWGNVLQYINAPPGDITTGLVGYWQMDEMGGTTAADASGTGNTGTLNGPGWCAGRVGAGALSFDGVNDYVQIGARPNLVMTSALSVGAWIYPTGTGGIIVAKEGEYELAIINNSVMFAIANTAPGWTWVDTGFAPPLNQWTHLAFVYGNGVAALYCNGNVAYSCNGSGNIGDAVPTMNDFRIGGRQYTAQFFAGRIDEVRVYNRALSVLDAAALYARPSYVLTYPDGSQQIFSQPNTVNSGARRMFLSAWTDPAGNAVQFVYENPLRLKCLVDAIGQTTTLHYDWPGDSYKVTQIEDPFHRSAFFDYDQIGRLKKITDVISMTSEFTYSASDPNFISSMTTPYGTSTFLYDETPSTGDRWLVMTDPNGDKEKVHAVSDLIEIGPWPNPNLVEPIPDVDPSLISYGATLLEYRNTLYFGKKAIAQHNNQTDVAHLDADYAACATIYHFLHDDDYSREAPTMTSPILESIKFPLENRIWLFYPGQTSSSMSFGITNRQPSLTARVVENESGAMVTQTNVLSYNSRGLITSFTDPKGRCTSFTYYPNDQDLWKVSEATGTDNQVLIQLGGYVRHRPTTFTDAALQTYALTWDGRGMLRKVVNPKLEVTQLNRANGYLQNIQQIWTGGTKTSSFTYDGFGRVHTATSSDGYTLTYDYDLLDRLTKVTYPDTTFERYEYSRLDLVRTVDRNGNSARMGYDGLGHLSWYTNRLGHGITYTWCGCGGLDSLTDSLGHHTSWVRDVEGRVTEKDFEDGNAIRYGYEGASGRLSSVTDAKNQVKTYAYYADDTLASMSYSGGSQTTPNVTFTYESNFQRPKTITVGSETNTLNYYGVGTLGAGKLFTEDGPLTGDVDKTTYAYDELGRIVNRTVGGVAETFGYDALGRVTSHGTALGAFTPAYVGDTARLLSLAYPNGQTTAFDYFDSVGDLALKEIWNKAAGGSVTVSKFDYTYDTLKRISQWTLQADSGTPQVLSPTYDLEGQLLDVGVAQNQSLTMEFAYVYDAMGNRTGEQIDTLAPSRSTTVGISSHNNVNQLTSKLGSGSLPVRFHGKIDEPGTVTVQGHTAKMTQDPSSLTKGKFFDATVNLAPGNNTVTVVATDLDSGEHHSATNSYSVTVAGAGNQGFAHDANGNRTAAGLPAVVEGKFGEALSFNGTSQYASVNNSSSLAVGGAFSVSAWVYPTDVSSGRYGVFSTRVNNDTGSWQLEVGTCSGGAGMVGITGVGTYICVSGNNVIPANQWSFITYTRNGNSDTGKLYVNGAQKTPSLTAAYTVANNSSAKRIGQGTAGAQLFSGKIDELRLYSRALTAAEVTSLYNNQSVASGLVAYWTFDASTVSSTTAADSTVNGNTAALAGGVTYEWDAENRITAVNNGVLRSEFSYDGFGRRTKIVEKNNGVITETKKFVWCGTELVQQLDGSGVVTRRLFAEGEQIGGVNYYYTRDHLGSVREMTDSSCVIRARYDYDPYGRRGANQITSNPVEADFGFTGHYFHSQSGLHLALFRAYDANTGRWLNRDPIGEDGGLNLYGYVGNNPISWIDPLGLTIFPAGWVGPLQPGDGYRWPYPASDVVTMMGGDGSMTTSDGGPQDLSVPAISLAIPASQAKSMASLLANLFIFRNRTIGEGPGCMRRLQYEPNPKHGPFQRGSASPAPQNGQGALDGSVGFSENSAGRVGLDADGVPVVFQQHREGLFHGYRVPFRDLTSAQQNALIRNGFVNRRGLPLP